MNYSCNLLLLQALRKGRKNQVTIEVLGLNPLLGISSRFFGLFSYLTNCFAVKEQQMVPLPGQPISHMPISFVWKADDLIRICSNIHMV